MAIKVTCQQCGKDLAVRNELAGRKGKYPGSSVRSVFIHIWRSFRTSEGGL